MLTIAGDIVTPGGVLTGGALVVDESGTIAELYSRANGFGHPPDIDTSGFLILPGFIDMHVHGGGGADFMDVTPEAVRTALRTHARFGTTSLLATTLTESREAITDALCAIGTVYDAPRAPDEANIVGVHLEGPYLCPARRGAQPLAHIRPPDKDEFAGWFYQSIAPIKQITLAPEMPGALELINFAVAEGITVSLGHTDADADTAERAIDSGARQATHLFNAMRPLHHREPGIIGAALTRPEVLVEIIADGVHLDPRIVRLIVAAKGIERVVLITDAMSGAAMPDGEYALGGFPVTVQNGTATFSDGTLAGSVLTMNVAYANARRFAGLSIIEASQISSTNAARQLGQAHRIGALSVGMDADMVVLHPETGRVEVTIIGGRVAYRR